MMTGVEGVVMDKDNTQHISQPIPCFCAKWQVVLKDPHCGDKCICKEFLSEKNEDKCVIIKYKLSYTNFKS